MNSLKKLIAVSLVAGFAFASTTNAATFTFTKSLKQGSKGADVKSLQQFLNMCADTMVTATGKETTTFGPATKRAVIAFQKKNGVPATGTFGPISAAAAAKAQTMSNVCTSIVGGSTNPTNPTTPTQTGPITASLSTDNPAAGTIIAGQAGADLARITFTGTGTVSSVTLTRGGVADSSTLSNIYLYDGATRITDGYTFNNTGILTMNNVNLMVNGSKTISVKADVASSTTSYSVAINLTGFTASGTSTSAMVKGNEMFIASGSGILASANLTTSAPSPSATQINAGSMNQTLWSNNVSIGLHAAQLTGFTIKQIGSAPSNTLSNVALYVDGVNAGTATINSNNQFVFNVATPVTLSTGSHLLEVRGDVTGGANRNFYMSVEKSSDIMIRDPQTSNVAVAVTYLGSTLNNVNGGLVTINNGSLTINQDTSFNNTTTLVGGATTTKLAAWKFTGYGEDVKVNSLSFTPTFTSLSTGTTLANVGLYVNGGQVGSNATATHNTTLSFTNLGSNLTVYTGTPAIVELRGDVVSSSGTALTSGTVKFDLVAGSSNAQGLSSSQLTSTSSSGGQTLTIGNNVTFGATSGFATSTKAPNATAVKIGSFSISAGSAEGLTINNISVTLPVGSGNTMQPQNQLTNLTVKEGSTVVGTPIGNPVITTSNSFSANTIVAQGTTKVFDVYADFGSNAATYTVTPSMAITYRGNTSNLSTTTSTVAGSQTTANVSSLLAAGVTFNNGLSLPSQAVVGPAASFPIGTFNFKAATSVAGSVVKDVTFTVPAGTVTSITMNGQTGTVVGTTATIYNVGVTVPADASGINVPVTAALTCVGTANGCASAGGVSVTATISTVTYNNGSTVLSISPVTANVTNTHYIYASKPALTVDSVQKTGLVLAAENKIGEVTIAADAAGQIKVNNIAFNIASSGLTSPTVASVRIADGNTTVSGSAVDSGCTAVGACVVRFGTTSTTDGDGYTIAPGTSKTFSLYATVGGTPVASTVVTFSSSVTASTFSWDDTTGGATNQAGTNLYNFPTASYSIRQ